LIDKGGLVDKPVAGLSKAAAHGQGGLLDVVLHPKYVDNGWIYWTYNASVGDLHGTDWHEANWAAARKRP